MSLLWGPMHLCALCIETSAPIGLLSLTMIGIVHGSGNLLRT